MIFRRLRLRTRVTLFFALVALVAGVGLSVVTYVLARTYVVRERTAEAKQAAAFNANAVGQYILLDPENLPQWFRNELNPESTIAVLTESDSSTRSTNPSFRFRDFPAELQEAVAAGQSGTQRFEWNGDPYVAVAIELRRQDATYIEAFSMKSADRTLRAVQTALIIGAVGTTALAMFFGWSTSRRLLRPVGRMADAAGDIGAGGLGTRLEPEQDPDLNRMVTAFNEMADTVQARIEREARFASDVSHELRTPITALSAAIEVMQRRRGELPERTGQALDVVVSQVRRFNDMVIDLLELSRLDAGVTELSLEEVDLQQLAEHIATRAGHADVPIDAPDGMSTLAITDPARIERILTNLLQNADVHAGGAVRIAIDPSRNTDDVLIAVEDSGPGVAHSERARIFERFARGSAARHRVGTGLGLALVAEHAEALGGRSWVEDRPGGGARFVVQLKAVHE